MKTLSIHSVRQALLLAGALAAVAMPGQGQDEPGKNGWVEPLIGTLSQITLAAEHGTLFYGYDRLTYPGEPVDLTARVRWVRTMKDVPGVTIEFRQGDNVLGRAKTDEDGVARLEWKPPKAGDYEFTADIYAVPDPDYNEMLQVTPAPLVISARPKQTRFVVIDLDRTVVDASFFRVIVGGARSMSGAASAVAELARTREVIYLTHRPDVLMVKSRNWLKQEGFPRGTLMVSRLSQAFGSSGKFKAQQIRTLRMMFPGVEIGIGDKISDAEAYVANGMTAYLIPHYDRDDEEDCRELAEKINKINKDIQVVDTWEQVLDGIQRGRKFPAGTYARNLRKRADQLKAEEKRKHDEEHRRKHDDDDDD